MLFPEAFVRRCSVKKVVLEISQHSQENICAGDFFHKTLVFKKTLKKESWVQVFSCEFYKIPKNIFFSRTLAVAATVFHASQVLNKTLFCISFVA